MDYDSSDEDTDPLAQRRRLVKQWHSLGESMAKTARILGVTVRQVEHDYKVLGLQCFSDASDAELRAHVSTFLEQQHLGIGRRKIAALLEDEGLRIPRRRIADVMEQLGHRRAPHQKMKRRSYTEAVGAHFLWSMDQNEKIGFGGVKVLQALDSKWRCPIYYEVVTSLRGLDHSLFFLGAVRHWKLVPYNVIVDGAPAWCGVREMMKIWWHDCLDPVLVPHDDGDMLVERVTVTSSVHNPMVERSWVDVNHVTRKYRLEWKDLEGRKLLRGGRNKDPADLFCLAEVYIPSIKRDLDQHFAAMARRRKEKSTRNPNFPAGTWRPITGLMTDVDYSRHVDDAQIDAMETYIRAFHGAADEEPASSWEVDPLETDAQRALRADLVSRANPQSLADEYVVMRQATEAILDG